MKITQISIVARGTGGSGPDHILLETDLPGAVYPFDTPAGFSMIAAAGTGLRYCQENFKGIPIIYCEAGRVSPVLISPDPPITSEESP